MFGQGWATFILHDDPGLQRLKVPPWSERCKRQAFALDLSDKLSCHLQEIRLDKQF